MTGAEWRFAPVITVRFWVSQWSGSAWPMRAGSFRVRHYWFRNAHPPALGQLGLHRVFNHLLKARDLPLIFKEVGQRPRRVSQLDWPHLSDSGSAEYHLKIGIGADQDDRDHMPE